MQRRKVKPKPTKEVVTARVPITLLVEFALRTAPPRGLTIVGLFFTVARLSDEMNPWDIKNAAEILVLEGRADKMTTQSGVLYLPPANPRSYR